MNDQQNCPHCGAEIRGALKKRLKYYLCFTNAKHPSERDKCCYERQIEQQAAEIEQLKQAAREERAKGVMYVIASIGKRIKNEYL